MAGIASASTYVAGALFGRLALCRYNNIVSGLGQTNQPAIRKQRFASPKPTRQLAMEEQQFLFRAGRVDGSVRTVDVGIPPPIVHHLHVPLSLSLSTQYVGPLRCVELFNQKHVSPRLASPRPNDATCGRWPDGRDLPLLCCTDTYDCGKNNRTQCHREHTTTIGYGAYILPGITYYRKIRRYIREAG